MQDTQSDLDNSRRLGVDEQQIKFRPSPNFKNMKKFLKYKKDLESSSQSPPNASSDETTPNTAPESPPTEQKETQSPVQQNIQPPLPREPPPPYSKPIIPIPLKQEIIDDEYPENGQESPNLCTAQTEPPQQELNIEKKTEEPDSTSTEICRDFVRGTCIRGENCRYAHRFDRSQLLHVYTFCKNYQNVRCTYPFCKYVHATVFEEQEFYRTGVLPNHAINNFPFYLMPPPPPPPELPELTPKVQNTNATSPIQAQPSSTSNPIFRYVNASKVDSKAAEGFEKKMKVTLKREWTRISFSTPPRDLDNKENYAKKCKNCDTMDNRLQYNKEKIDSLKKSAEEHKTKSTLLSRKSNALFTVLFTVLKSQAASIDGMNRLTATLNNCGEKEKALIQHILGSHRSHSSNMIT